MYLSPAVRAHVYAVASVGWLYRRIATELAGKRRDNRYGLVAQVRCSTHARFALSRGSERSGGGGVWC